jgi:uncharacterized membrane protein
MQQLFPAQTLDAIEQSVHIAEAQHQGQIRFAIEAALPLPALLANQSSRARALEVFAQLGVWDTEHNNGVLIYLLLADRKVEIVADRGIHAKLGDATWVSICRAMEYEFRNGNFEQGARVGVKQVADSLTAHYPQVGDESNELPDRPILMS